MRMSKRIITAAYYEGTSGAKVKSKPGIKLHGAIQRIGGRVGQASTNAQAGKERKISCWGPGEQDEQPYAQERAGGVIYLGASHEKLCQHHEHAVYTSTSD